AVTGGGNVAIEDANYLSNICSKVYLIHRRDTFRADDADVAELKKKDNVEFILNSNVTKLNGDNVLESIEVTNKITNEVKTIPLSGLFIAVGQVPENENFRDLVNIDDRGYIIANESCETNVPGIFVAGDARTKTLRQLVTAEADGAIAATSASRIK
ncbi:MAG TPA: FAD-dependent oxidoreductase, partial [Bacilli bacterium]|nr:FAD-dependent oxidoreductase [Bacilli bacterium]